MHFSSSGFIVPKKMEKYGDFRDKFVELGQSYGPDFNDAVEEMDGLVDDPKVNNDFRAGKFG